MVKSDAELALQRIDGRNNALAAMNTIHAIEKGMTFEEIERRCVTEAAALGNEIQSFIAGVTLALLPDGVTVPGKPFLIDPVSHFRQYHGDFGCAVVIGEPSREILARERAHKVGRDAVFEIVRPGVQVFRIAARRPGSPDQGRPARGGRDRGRALRRPRISGLPASRWSSSRLRRSREPQ